ncbi:hypothetical protein C8F04DRAFT_99048 [Mycena alexandri]|uniref:Uncharacterized protein n=1 Tax=Mycena alexandri TaxID=1745969 RepID=A0AAD6XBJ1_9AGAR|nr:hypothetical protein C8F04DRAFT_99048 [Mycena alexandri]
MAFDIDDAVAIDMARAWPRIHDLELMTPAYHAQDPAPRVSLAALLAFAQYCPCLGKLRIVLDASVVPVAVACTLTCLDAGYSAILTAPSVANFLSGLFPLLSALYTDHDGERYPGPDGMNLEYSDAFHLIWKQVETLICESDASLEEP